MSGISGGGMGGTTESAGVLVIDVTARLDQLESSMRQMEQRADQAGETSGGSIRDKIGGAIGTLPGIALAAGAAIGAAIASGLKTAYEMASQARQGILDMQASLGVTAKEARELGEVAQAVFGNNWTGSLEEAQKAVSNVRKEVQGLSKEDLQTVTEGSVAIAERFEEDQGKVAASVQALMKATGMGAKEALDFISAGFQKGLNTSGDFLDTLNEYAPQFEKAKISGDQLFSLLETGAQKGALGTDKIADAFKEFGLTFVSVSSSSKAAYAQLGLDQEALLKKVSDGSMTQTQLFELTINKLKGVKDQAEKTNIATALYGGAGEDMAAGLDKISLTQTKMESLKGSTETVKNATNTLGSVFQTAWRQVQLQLIPIGDLMLDLANEAMPSVKAAIERVGPVVTAVVRGLVEGWKEVRPALEPVGELFKSVFGLIVTLWNNVLKPVLVAISPFIDSEVKVIGTALGFAVRVVTDVVNAVAALFRGDWKAAWASLKDIATGAVDGLIKGLHAADDKFFAWATNIVAGIGRGLSGLKAMLLEKMADALTALEDKMPEFMRGTVQRAADAARAAAGEARSAAQTTGGPVPGMGPVGLTPINMGNDIVAAAFGKTGNQMADTVAGWCARWVRLTLEKAEPNAAGQIEKFFAGNADDVKNRMKGLGKLRKDLGNLEAGDAVIYDKNHIGLYIGNGLVRGNNEWGIKNGRGVVSNEGLHSLGSIAGYVKLSEVVKLQQTTPATQQPKTSNTPAATVALKPKLEAKDIQSAISDKVKDVQVRLQLALIGKGEAVKELQAIEASATQLGRKADPKNMAAYAAGAQAAHAALEGLKKSVAPTVNVLAELERQYEYAGKAGLPAYVMGLKAYLAQQEKVVSSTKAGTKAHTDAMDAVISARQKLATVQKAADLGLSAQAITTYKTRAQEVIGLEKAMATSTDLDWKRRAQNRIDAYKSLPPEAQKVLELLKSQDSQQVESAKKRQAALDSVNRAVAEGHIQAARRSLDEAARLQAEEVNNNRLSADQRVAAYQASTGKVLGAAYALHAEEKRQANAAVDAWAKSEEGKALSTQQRDAEVTRRKAANRETERQANLVSQREQTKLYQGLTDTQIAEGERAAEAVHKQAQDIASTRYKMTADLVRYSYGQGEEGLYTALSSVTGYSIDQVRGDVDEALAEAQRLNSSLTNTIKEAYAEPLKAHADAVAAASAEESRAIEMSRERLNEIVQANQEAAKSWGWLLDPLHQKAEETGEAVDDTQAIFEHFVGQAKELLSQGVNPQQSGFIQYLEEFAKGSDAAAVAAQRLLNMRDKFLVQGDTVMDGPVAALPTRTPKPVTPTVPDRGAAALPARSKPSSFAPTPEQARGEQQAIARLNEWNAMLESKRLDDYKASLGKMTDAQLKEALAKAEASKNTLRYTLLLEEQKRRQEESTHSLENSINKWGDYAKQIIPVVTAAMTALGGTTDDVAGQWAEDMTSMASDLVTFGSAIAKGNWVGAAVQALTTIFGWFSRNKKAAQEAAKATADYNAQFQFSDNGYKTRDVTKYTTGALLWKTDHYKEKVDEVGKALAQSLESGFTSGMENGFNEAIKMNDFSLFEKSLTESVGQAVLKGLIDAFMQEEVLKKIIGPRIKAVIDASHTDDGGVDDAREAINLKNAVGEATNAAQTYYDTVLKPIAETFGQLGSGLKDAAATSDTSTVADTSPKAVNVTLPSATANFNFDVLQTLANATERNGPRLEKFGAALEAALPALNKIASLGSTAEAAAQTMLQSSGLGSANAARLERLLSGAELKPTGSYK